MTDRSRLLLDTHVFLWWRAAPDRIRPDARDAIATAEVVFVSAATAWEASVKAALGKLDLPDTIERGVDDSGFTRLVVGFSHAAMAGALPPHHRDPFDRMLIAQARIEDLTLVTHDEQLRPYDVRILWA